jgi:hypothetical protein
VRVEQYTTDPTLLLVAVYLKGRDGHGWTGSTGGGTITYTVPAGGATSTRALVSRGGGRYEMQLTADDVTVVGNAWIEAVSPIGSWLDFATTIEIYPGGTPPPPPPVPTPVQDAAFSPRRTVASPFRQPRSRAKRSVRRR